MRPPATGFAKRMGLPMTWAPSAECWQGPGSADYCAGPGDSSGATPYGRLIELTC